MTAVRGRAVGCEQAHAECNGFGAFVICYSIMAASSTISDRFCCYFFSYFVRGLHVNGANDSNLMILSAILSNKFHRTIEVDEPRRQWTV